MQLYVDENKSKDYFFAVTAVPTQRANSARKFLKKLKFPGQRSIHFVNEKPARRNQILDQLVLSDLQVHIIRAPGLRDIPARKACLQGTVALAESLGANKIVFELDETLLDFDSKILREEIHLRGLRTSLVFLHLPRDQEPLLWVSDAIAWSLARGAEFGRKAQRLVRTFEDYPR